MTSPRSALRYRCAVIFDDSVLTSGELSFLGIIWLVGRLGF